MYSLLIALAMSNPGPTELSDLTQAVMRNPVFKGFTIEACVNGDCVTVDRQEEDLFNPANYNIMPQWETVYKAPDGDNKDGRYTGSVGSKGPSMGGGAGGAASAAATIVSDIVKSTSVGGSVEIEFETTKTKGDESESTKVKVKVTGGKGVGPMKTNNQ